MAASKESRETDPFSVRALVRGLSILGLFDVDHREWTIDEIAEQTGLLRMTAYRMVRTLESMAFLVRDASANRYRLGPAALALTYIAEDNSSLVQAARPFLEDSPGTPENRSRSPSISTASRCAWTSSTPPGPSSAAQRPAAYSATLSRCTASSSPHTGRPRSGSPVGRAPPAAHARTPLWTPTPCAPRWSRSPREGVAYDIEGIYLGTCAVGAPVRDQVGSIAATVSVVVPTGGFGPVERELCTQAVKSAAPLFPRILDGIRARLPSSRQPRRATEPGEVRSRVNSDRSAKQGRKDDD